MTTPAEKPVELPQRSPGALWGTAHLAWGVAIFVALLYAAQRLPVDSTDWLKRLATAFFGLGLAYLALSGWRVVERGWRLRRPLAPSLPLALIDLSADALLAAAMIAALARAEQSRLLTAGLDRLVSALAVICLVSLVLSLMAWYSLGGAPGYEASDRRLSWIRLALAMEVAILAAVIELSSL